MIEVKEGAEKPVFFKSLAYKRGLDINEDSPVGDALLRLKLLKDGKPTNGAVLLFDKDPQRRFIQSEVKELIEMVGKGRGVHYILRMKRTISGQLADD